MPLVPGTHDLVGSAVDVPTPDGVADSYLVRPAADGRYPAVLMFMDAIGLRPRLEEMADRIAAEGYVVLVPNLIYRSGRAPVIPDLVARLQSEDRATALAELGPHMRQLTPEAAARDTLAYVEYLEQQPSVVPDLLGTTGYCMGGALSLRAAAQLPDKVTAAASFHGGNLAPDDPNGPHHLAPRIRAELYLAHADNDRSMPAEQITRLEEALSGAGVTYTSEVYEGALHGFTMSDMAAVYNAEAEQRHWDALLALFRRRL